MDRFFEEVAEMTRTSNFNEFETKLVDLIEGLHHVENLCWFATKLSGDNMVHSVSMDCATRVHQVYDERCGDYFDVVKKYLQYHFDTKKTSNYGKDDQAYFRMAHAGALSGSVFHRRRAAIHQNALARHCDVSGVAADSAAGLCGHRAKQQSGPDAFWRLRRVCQGEWLLFCQPLLHAQKGIAARGNV